MRAAVVFIPAKNRDKLMDVSKGLARGIESQGHQVDLVDGSKDVTTKLTIYQYLAVGTEVTSFFGGKLPSAVKEYLTQAGIVGGKRCFAFVLKKPIGATKGLTNLMKTMESEGMFLKYSEVLSTPEEAEEIGKRLNVESPL
jgi:hypothetical protein